MKTAPDLAPRSEIRIRSVHSARIDDGVAASVAARTVALNASLVLSAFAALVCGFGCRLAAPPFPTLRTWDELEPPTAFVESDERALWQKTAKSLEELRSAKVLFDDPALIAYLETVVARLVPPIAEGGPRFRVYVVRDVEANAMALPDGTLVIALPLLATFENEAQLAFVLGHEIVHVTGRHSLLSDRYDALTDSHVERMRLSRRLEADADRGAIRLMAAAGYDPRAAEPALQHVEDTSETPPHSIRAWESHDRFGSRLNVIRTAVDLTPTRETSLAAERFDHAMDGCRLAAAELELDAGRFDRGLAAVTRHVARRPNDARAYVLRARIAAERDPSLRFSAAVAGDLERAVELAPLDPPSLRALGLFLRDTGETDRSRAFLRRYLEADPEAFDRKLIERYVGSGID